MPSSKVIVRSQTEKSSVPFIPPTFEAQTDKDFLDNEWESTQGAFVLDPTQKEIAGLDEVQRIKIDEMVEAKVLDQMAQLQEEAFAKGFELGRSEGQQLALQETNIRIDSELVAFNELLTNAQVQYAALAKMNESRLLELIFKISHRLAAKELEINADALLEVVRQSISSISAQDGVVLEIHPDRITFFEEIQLKANREFDFLKNIKIEPNPQINPGGCLIRTQFGQIDAQVETRVDNLWHQLKQVIPQVG